MNSSSQIRHLLVRQWVAAMPAWVGVQTPKETSLDLNVHAGELEAICLAKEIHADAVLMDDRAGRNAATHCGLFVVGTLGVLELAAARKLIDLPKTVERLRHTNARLDPELIHVVLERDKSRE